jgi:hypothetical protein
MKKGILLMAIMVPFVFCLSVAFSDETKTEAKDENIWETYNQKGEFVGTIKQEQERFIFYDKDEINLKQKDKNEWEMYNQDDEFVGLLKKEQRCFKFYDKQKRYLGLILLESKDLMPRGYNAEKKGMLDDKIAYKRTAAKITPETARLYLYVLKAIEKIK